MRCLLWAHSAGVMLWGNPGLRGFTPVPSNQGNVCFLPWRFVCKALTLQCLFHTCGSIHQELKISNEVTDSFSPFTYCMSHAVFPWEILSHARWLRELKRGVEFTNCEYSNFSLRCLWKGKAAWEQKVNVLQKVRHSYVSHQESTVVTEHNILLWWSDWGHQPPYKK